VGTDPQRSAVLRDILLRTTNCYSGEWFRGPGGRASRLYQYDEPGPFAVQGNWPAQVRKDRPGWLDAPERQKSLILNLIAKSANIPAKPAKKEKNN